MSSIFPLRRSKISPVFLLESRVLSADRIFVPLAKNMGHRCCRTILWGIRTGNCLSGLTTTLQTIRYRYFGVAIKRWMVHGRGYFNGTKRFIDMSKQPAVKNPFAITKAIDFNDDQILEYWVNMPGTKSDGSDLARPTSPMPIYLLGGKGSGKTHLMRYHSFRLQELRSTEEGIDVREGIKRDGYVGIYLRCNGLNAGRFAGKRQSEERWSEIFAYYVELWLAQHALEIGMKLNLGSTENDEAALCAAITSLFDRPLNGHAKEIHQLLSQIERERHELDFHINNCVMTGTVDKDILTTRGKLVFGIPKIFQSRYKFLDGVSFIYAIDEFETLSHSQQKLFNSFVRDRELPTTFRIGARLYGVKTDDTDSDQEQNIEDSEFERTVLDEEFRKAKSGYARFAGRLAYKRFLAAARDPDSNLRGPDSFQSWAHAFDKLDESWESPCIWIWWERRDRRRGGTSWICEKSWAKPI